MDATAQAGEEELLGSARDEFAPDEFAPDEPRPAGAPIVTVYAPKTPVDLRATLASIGRGPHDPTTRWDARGLWRAWNTPHGPASLRLEQPVRLGPIQACAWGPGAEWAIDGVPALLGADDDWSQLDLGAHPLLAETRRRMPGLRLPRTRRVLEALAPAILEQKVTSLEALRSWARLVRAFGEPAPGPAGIVPPELRAAPTAERWRTLPSWEFHRAGVDPRRARVLVQAAARGASLEGVTHREQLSSLPGIGPWTAAETAQRSHGDPDAVSVGDYHLAHQVGHVLAGERDADDARMLELLAPWAGQRHRVVLLILLSGALPERRGPRATITDHRMR